MQTPLYEQHQKQRLRAGEEVFKEGDTAQFAYIIEEGEIEIWTTVKGKQLVLNILGVGSLFGELALVDQQPRSASATARADSLLILVTNNQISRRIQEADPILQLFFWVITHHFRSASGHFQAIKDNVSLPIFGYHQKNNFQLSEKIEDAVELIRMENDLQNAIAEEEFKLVYQPIINLENNQIQGFEALIRWQNSQRGYVYPNDFIPLAESTSLIIPIGKWVIQKGMQDLKKMEEISGQSLFMSFNIASIQIEDPNFIPWMLSTAKENKVQPSQIKLEILERTLFSSENTLNWVHQCRSHGFLLVLDDFGTGYSSLQYLNEFNLDMIKIDQSFVQGLGINPNSQVICQAIINLSQVLKMGVVAEGIDKETNLEILRKMGCNFGQGYFFSKPLSFKKAISFLN